MFRAIVEDGALVNNAATEEGGGSPARGAVPGTTAVAEADGTWRLTGEKTWTTWLPNLTHAFVTARIAGTDPVEVGVWLVDLSADGVERRPGFEAMGMRGSASGRLVLDGVQVPAEALVVDHAFLIPDEESVPICFQLLEEEGLCMGGSTGVNVAGAIRLAKELGPGSHHRHPALRLRHPLPVEAVRPGLPQVEKPARARLA